MKKGKGDKEARNEGEERVCED